MILWPAARGLASSRRWSFRFNKAPHNEYDSQNFTHLEWTCFLAIKHHIKHDHDWNINWINNMIIDCWASLVGAFFVGWLGGVLYRECNNHVFKEQHYGKEIYSCETWMMMMCIYHVWVKCVYIEVTRWTRRPSKHSQTGCQILGNLCVYWFSFRVV